MNRYFQIKFMGYYHQYTRNNLQFNRRNGMFSEKVFTRVYMLQTGPGRRLDGF